MSEVVGGYHTGGQPEKKEQETALPNEDLQLKTWRCKNGHGLGFVIIGDPVLWLWGESQLEHILYGPRVIAKITGSAEIQCTICGDKRTWHHATERTEQFIEKITKRRTES